jgi:hypothetical protein
MTRRRTLALAIAGLVLVVVVATVVAVVSIEQDPDDVVRDYLDAIRGGDIGTALAIAGKPEARDRVAFLDEKALADDWTVDAVVERHRRDDDADVDVTIRAGGRSEQGRFHMVHDDDGWHMESPFVQVDLTAAPMNVIELGRARAPVKRADTSSAAQLLVFPGVYRLYPSLTSRVTFDPATLIATPRGAKDAVLRVDANYTLTDAGTLAVQQSVDAHVDECAKTTRTAPPGCPFNAEESRALRGLTDVSDVRWTMVTRPVAHVVTNNVRDIAVVVRTPGTVRLSGSGAPEEGGPRTTFAVTCEFGLTNLALAMTIDGFTVTAETEDPYRAASETRCF